MRALDEILLENNHAAPFGIKIDAEGFEMEVLKGAGHVILMASFVIIEVSVKRRFALNYKFSEVVNFMASRNFELLDVLNAGAAEPNFLDCLFVPYSSSRLD